MIKLKRNRKKFISMIPFNTLAFHLVLFHIKLILRIEVNVLRWTVRTRALYFTVADLGWELIIYYKEILNIVRLIRKPMSMTSYPPRWHCLRGVAQFFVQSEISSMSLQTIDRK